MKGKILTAGAAVVAAVCLCLGLAACGGKGDNGGVGGEEQTCEHEYTADNVCALCGKKWEYTEGLHYVYDEGTDTYAVGKNSDAGGDVVIPYGYQGKFVTKIGELAFSVYDGSTGAYDSELTSITIPDCVTSIGDSAFLGCYGLTSIAIPDSVTSVGEMAFCLCDGLMRVDITDLAAWCKIDFGSEYANPLESAHHLFLDGEEVTTLLIPEGITKIKGDAFSGCMGLRNVTIPDSVTSIGEGAFEGCSGLTGVTIGNGVTEIGQVAFGDCYKLIEVWDRSGLEIQKGTGENGSVAYYAKYVYTGNEASKQTVTDDGYIFYEDGAEVYLLGYCGTEKSLALPAKSPSGKEYAIYQYALYGCRELTSVTIGGGVTSIGQVAFSGCYGLTEITISDSVTEIGEYAFWGCTALTGIEIPDSVTSIGSGAFYKCTALTSVTIPDSVTSIGWGAFESCDELTAVTIGRGVTEIEGAAFGGCYKLIEVWNHSGLDIQKGESWYDVAYYAKYVYTGDEVSKQTATDDGYLFFEDGTEVYLLGYRGTETALTLPAKSPSGKEYAIYQYAFYMRTELTGVTIGNGVTAIGERAFYDCRGLTGVTIESGVTEIGESAFAFCIGLTGIEIPDSVVSIGEYAFIGCLGLTRVTIGNGVTEIGGQAFASTELTDIQFKGTVAEWQEVQKGSWWDSSIGDYTVTCTDGTVDKEGNVTDF